MREMILKKLDEIEKSENVRIIHAVESGSRAWGFASPDSDYDVRFIYIRPIEYYLKLEKTRDVIEWQLDDTFDINGWDLQKTLRLLYKCNPAVFEWNNSPIVYKTTSEWQKVSDVINNYFDPKSNLHHYYSMAKSNYCRLLQNDEIKLKKYFYVIRPILACRWIIDKSSPPPVLFSELYDAELDDSIKPIVDKLIEMKINTPETANGKRIKKLENYIGTSFAEIKKVLSEMPEILDNNQNNWETLDKLFVSLLI